MCAARVETEECHIVFFAQSAPAVRAKRTWASLTVRPGGSEPSARRDTAARTAPKRFRIAQCHLGVLQGDKRSPSRGRSLIEDETPSGLWVLDFLYPHTGGADRVGVTGTPLFLIDGQVVFGADIPRMESILGSKK